MIGDSYINVPQNLDDKEAVKRCLVQLVDSVNELKELKYTDNPKQDAISDLESENPSDIVSKINEILLVLRKSNIISG